MDTPLQLIVNALLILLLLVWVGYRQTTWRAVDPTRMWRLPVILAVVGLATLSSTGSLSRVSGLDVAMLVAELLLAFAVGALMGAISRFRPMSAASLAAHRTRYGEATTVTLQTRTGWTGLALWIVLIAVRVGLDVVAVRMGSGLAASTGVILLMVAVNRVARVAVILARSSRQPVQQVASGTY
ncbi:hypothetical protein [Microbacterium sp.]|uniref:hypothetical protein n=1 Tax=Microbacterium sp. TaxID=51671 RepID=UPI0039E5643C